MSITAIELYVRNFVINKNFGIYQVDKNTFPHYRLIDEFSSPRITISNNRREQGSRGDRERRIGFIGDSVTFGIGVSDSAAYTEILQASQNKYDIYNYGVPGYGLVESAVMLDSILSQRKYEVIVYTFNFNDIHPLSPGYLSLLKDSGTHFSTIDNYQGSWGKYKLWTKDNLKFLFVLKELWQKDNIWVDPAPIGSNSLPEYFKAKCYDDLLAECKHGEHLKLLQLWLNMYSDPKLLSSLRKKFLQMDKKAQAHGTQLVILPFYDFHIMEYHASFFKTALHSLLSNNQISYIETFPLFEKEYRECGFYSDVGHPGIRGNELIAELILQKLGLIDQ